MCGALFGQPQPTAQVVQQAAPSKSDKSVVSQADEQRRRLRLSTLGFRSNFKTNRLGTGGDRGASQESGTQPLSRVTLGS